MTAFFGYAKTPPCFSRFAINRGKKLRLTQAVVPTPNLSNLLRHVLKRRNWKTELHAHRLKRASTWQSAFSREVDRERGFESRIGEMVAKYLDDACAVFARIRIVVKPDEVKYFADVSRFSRALVLTLWVINEVDAQVHVQVCWYRVMYCRAICKHTIPLQFFKPRCANTKGIQ